MLTQSKLQLVGCGLAAGLLFAGCSGGDEPTVDPTASGTPSPAVTAAATPEAAKTPEPEISPLGGKPATEEEKQYHELQKKAEGLVLSQSYKEAIPLLEQALQQQPEDLENSFYLLLSHGSLEMVPSKGSPAYPYAEKVAKLGAGSNEAQRAHSYLAGAEFKLPADFKYGTKTYYSHGKFIYEPKTPYKLIADAPLHTELGARLGRTGPGTLWEAEVAPKMVEGTVTLTKGTEVLLLSEAHFYYSLTSWRKPLPPEPKEYNDSIFEVNAFYVEVVSDGNNKGKKGWMVNQVDRYLDKAGDDPFGVWIPDRLGLKRESES